MDPVTIGLVVGAGISAYSSWQGGRAAAKAAKAQAKLKRAQISELNDRMKIQEGRLNEQGNAFQANQMGGFASSGVAIGTGNTLIAMEDTNMKIKQEVDDMKRDTVFKINQLKMGASVDLQQGRDAATAGTISAFGTLASGAATAGKYAKTGS